ncbi:somatostatin receptor type 5-like [Branchiostoma floridae]|uniref:Somatostatin receptor type 5-like n=1 Tax=Branchiostoma floridae TaxID=7739 RepID=A0A9J7KGI4_BRAFL|nr:somatostatin receptor type 5-like [Branchiostoma floridae]
MEMFNFLTGHSATMNASSAANWSFPNGTYGLLTPQPVPNAITAIVAPTVYGLVTALGLVGNLLVIYTLLVHTKTKDATSYYILNLSLADTLFMLGVPFISASSAMERWVFGRAMCKIVLSMDAMNLFNSVFNVAVLSVDRYLAIVRATSHPDLRRPKVAIAVSLSVWAAAFLLSIPVMVVSDAMEMWNADYMCMLDWPAENSLIWYKAFISYMFIVGFVIPLVVISVSYLRVVRHLKQNESTHTEVARVASRTRTKVTHTVLAMIVTFVICWLPFHLCQLVNLIADLQPTSGVAFAFHVAMVMSYANSCANPILYVFTSQKFRESLRSALGMKRNKSWTTTDHPSYYLHEIKRDAAVARRRRREENEFFEEENNEVNVRTLPHSASPQDIVMYETSV